jgi:predicted permease
MRGVRIVPIELMQAVIQDLRYGIRMLRRSPTFAAVAVTTLALGMGANTVVFSILNSLYWQTAPVRKPNELVASQGTHRGASFPEYQFYRDHNTSFDGLAAEYPTAHAYLQTRDDSEIVLSAIVSANYFDLLGVKPLLGRFFVPADEHAPQVAVLSYSMWQDRFEGDPDIVGKTVKLNGVSASVIGVAPPAFHRLFSGIDDDLWLPGGAAAFIVPHCNPSDYKCTFFDAGLIGRLKPRADLAGASAELNRLNQQWETIYPDLEKNRMRLYPARGIDPANRLEIAHLPTILIGIVTVLLLIACANIAGLLLSRGAARRKEIATRLALGAKRSRIARQLLTESAILAALGTAAGMLLLLWATSWLSSFPFVSTEGFRSYYHIGFDPLVFAATALLSILSVFLFGLMPAMRATSAAPMESLRQAGYGETERSWSRAGLVAGQVALAMVLCTAAILAVRSLSHVLMGPGFDPNHIAIVRVSPYRLGYPAEKSARLQSDALKRIAALPGVEAVTFGQLMPWWESWEDTVTLPGGSAGTRETMLHVHYNSIAPNYLDTLNIPLLRGRDFTEADHKGTPNVVIVNESLARHMWPGRDATGETLVIGGTPCAVVGVAQDAQYNPATDGTHLFFYRPYWQIQNNGDSRFLVRTAADAGGMLHDIKGTIRNIDGSVPIGEDSTATQALLNDFGPLRLTRAVLVFAGLAALILSVVGLYSVVAFLVATRTREIGIRLALGAARQRVLGLLLRQGLILALSGGIAGAVVAVLALPLLATMLYGINPADPLTLLSVWLFLMLSCLLASYIPARWATKVDPMTVLRYE